MDRVEIEPPCALLAELTYRCPLRCPYCSNPRESTAAGDELSTDEWMKVIDEAAALGVVQLHLSGGEPLVKSDLECLVERAGLHALYSNLITSGVGLTSKRARALAACGLNSVQLSLQAADSFESDRIAGARSFAKKRRAAAAVREAGLPLSLNVVLHRWNVDAVADIIDICVAWGAERIELANAQYYGWAFANRDWLLPTSQQIESAARAYDDKKRELEGRIELIWVLPDYYELRPKPCMGGWGRLQLTVSSAGLILPCPAAGCIAGLSFESVRSKSLEWTWYESESFNRFRGFDWMPEPCRSCEQRFVDYGGCRCQAFLLTGDAGRTDPVCQWAPDHDVVRAAVAAAENTVRQEMFSGQAVRNADRKLIYRSMRHEL